MKCLIKHLKLKYNLNIFCLFYDSGTLLPTTLLLLVVYIVAWELLNGVKKAERCQKTLNNFSEWRLNDAFLQLNETQKPWSTMLQWQTIANFTMRVWKATRKWEIWTALWTAHGLNNYVLKCKTCVNDRCANSFNFYTFHCISCCIWRFFKFLLLNI